MKLKLILLVLGIAGGSAFVLHGVLHKPMYSVAEAQYKQRELNENRQAYQCGRWMVRVHSDGEARLYYQADGCPVAQDPQVKEFLALHNDRLDKAPSLDAMKNELQYLERVAWADGMKERLAAPVTPVKPYGSGGPEFK